MKNIAASIRQKLLNKARTENRPFQELLQYYAMERFLYRLSVSPHKKNYILKGAMMLTVWGIPQVRSTMDIDFLGRTENSIQNIKKQFSEILKIEDTDGITFDISSIKTEHITEDADYHGIRINFSGLLDNAKITLHIDIGFGDSVFPETEIKDIPVMFDLSQPQLYCYNRETAIAEKFQAMIKLGMLNSRMKDFYDVWILSRQFDENIQYLAEAIQITFKRRKTEIPSIIIPFSDDFCKAKQNLWLTFKKRIKQDWLPNDFQNIINDIKEFIMPFIITK